MTLGGLTGSVIFPPPDDELFEEEPLLLGLVFVLPLELLLLELVLDEEPLLGLVVLELSLDELFDDVLPLGLLFKLLLDELLEDE